MNQTLVLKALADETRMNIITLLLQHNYCVRALSRKLEISEAAVSQHLRFLRDAGLLVGEKKGYFMHYNVNREVLHELAREMDELAEIERDVCSPQQGGCQGKEAQMCHNQDKKGCSDQVKAFCHGPDHQGSETGVGHCRCRHFQTGEHDA